MPRAFQLLDKTTKEPTQFAKIDDDVRAAFGKEPDAERYLFGWYNYIGQSACLGATDEKILETVQKYGENDEMYLVVKWILDRYTTSAWYEQKR